MRKMHIAGVFLGLLIATTTLPLTFISGRIELSVVSAAPSCADKGATGSGLNQGGVDPRLAPITDLSLLRTPPPTGTTYACAYFGGGGYRYYDAQDRLLGASTGLPGQQGYTYDENLKGKPVPTSCADTWDRITNPGICLVRALFAGVGSFFMWIGIKLATLAGALFEFVLQYGVVKFGLTLSYIKSGIDTGWAAIRDIANIIIIGMFVFIAINIILGVKDFGDKKKIARVLIVAVLINFSLLFSKAIIDASNFTAYQFYNQMVKTIDVGSTNVATPSGSLTTGPTQTAAAPKAIGGIAGKFMEFLGAQGIADSYDQIRAVQETQDSALLGLGYALLALIFLLAITFVFLYGTYLIITRAVLLVLIMLTSALAFASWLIPHSFIEEGWMKWWKALLKGAFFAPILMALLWATFNISNALVNNATYGGVKGGTLGKLAASASAELNIAALFNYILILGLLFASFKVASMLSHSITGFASIGSGVAAALMAPAIGGARLGGLLARGSIGAVSGGTYKMLRDRGWGLSDAGILQKATVRSARWLGQRTFDPLATKTGESLTKQLGGFMLGSKDTGKGGYLGVKKRQAKEAEELARALRPSEEARAAMAQAARNEYDADSLLERTRHERARDGADRSGAEEENRTRDAQQPERNQIANVARPAAQNALNQARQQIAEEQDRRQGMEDDYAREIRFTEQRISTARQRADAAEETAARTRLDEIVNQRTTARAGFDRIIAQRTQDAAPHEAEIARLNGRLEQLDTIARDAGAQTTRTIRTNADNQLTAIEEGRRAVSDQAAERTSVRSIAEDLSHWKSIYSEGIRDELGGAIREHDRDENIGATIRNLMRQQQQNNP